MENFSKEMETIKLRNGKARKKVIPERLSSNVS